MFCRCRHNTRRTLSAADPRRIRQCPPKSARVRLSPPRCPPRILSWRTLADSGGLSGGLWRTWRTQADPPRIRSDPPQPGGRSARKSARVFRRGSAADFLSASWRTFCLADIVRRGKKSAANIVRRGQSSPVVTDKVRHTADFVRHISPPRTLSAIVRLGQR